MFNTAATMYIREFSTIELKGITGIIFSINFRLGSIMIMALGFGFFFFLIKLKMKIRINY